MGVTVLRKRVGYVHTCIALNKYINIYRYRY